MGHNTPMKLSLIVLFAILLQCHDSVVEGVRDIELENQLRILNKTPIKTIKTKEGDVYDCIDINKQPSFNHPLLKNHVIQTMHVFHSINTMVDNDHETSVLSSSSLSSSSVEPSNKIAVLRKLGCPDGTVPIRRTSKEDLIRAKSFSKSQLRLSDINHNVGDQVTDDLENRHQGQILAIAQTMKDSGIVYLGIRARINIYNPPVVENQISTAQLWIENGPKEELDSLQAGLIVAPSFYGDNTTRLFGKWEKIGSKSEGCYDLLCPGFIQVDQDYPIGATIIDSISQFGGVQYDLKVSISQDEKKNWWLSVGDTKIGYWPVELGFRHLSGGSSSIAWGGLAQGTITTKIPPMGNGFYPFTFESFNKQCYMRQMKVIPAKTLNWEDPTRKIIDTFRTKKECADIIYYEQVDKKPEGYQHTIAFGGPGGDCGY